MAAGSPKIPKGRPQKKKTLEQEAQEFLKKERLVVPPELDQLGDFYAGCALSGLLASGKFLRSDEIVDEAFKYRDRMLKAKNNNNK